MLLRRSTNKTVRTSGKVTGHRRRDLLVHTFREPRQKAHTCHPRVLPSTIHMHPPFSRSYPSTSPSSVSHSSTGNVMTTVFACGNSATPSVLPRDHGIVLGVWPVREVAVWVRWCDSSRGRRKCQSQPAPRIRMSTCLGFEVVIASRSHKGKVELYIPI
jgi:hypothetical protein